MKLNKNKIITAVIIFIIILSAFFFFVFNFNIFKDHRKFMDQEIAACKNLNLNDACSFTIDNNNIIFGQCSRLKNSPLLCKPQKPQN